MTEIEEGIEEEFKLAQKLKDSYCDKSGKETDAKNAAKIFHQIGRIYRKRSPNKISLIKSAGLFNAAIVRKPSNIISQIEPDLSEVCQHILQQAEAKKQTANLIEKGQQVKRSVNDLRTEVKTYLRNSVSKIPPNATKRTVKRLKSKKISAIQKINELIADKYKKTMAELSQFCQNILGNPPTEFAIVGMGSLARKEITPYSDFEHIILLRDDDDSNKELRIKHYFKWFSVIFHVIILNVQETIIPRLNICCLNDSNSRLNDWYCDAITPRGISFDSMKPHACKFPLGRQQHTTNKQFKTELIKPVSKMLKYLTSDANSKNGYLLSDILTKTCFVYGNKNIFKQFIVGAQKYQNNKSVVDTKNEIQRQIKEDLNRFSTRFSLTNLKTQDSINIKQLVYRSTTIFVAALNRIHNISANSCFGTISEMKKNKKITKNTSKQLRYAIAIACEMRLRVYAQHKSQCDNAINLKHNGIKKFLDIVGIASTVNYFQIAYCLQCELRKQLNFTKLHFYTNPKLINLSIGLAFDLNDLTVFFRNLQWNRWDSNKFDFDSCIKQIEADCVLKLKGKNNEIQSTSLHQKQLKTIADYLYFEPIYDEALEFYKKYLHRSLSDCDEAMVNYRIGVCLNELNRQGEALTYLIQARDTYENETLNSDTGNNLVKTLQEIGRCHLKLQQNSEALKYFCQALEIYKNATFNADTDKISATTFHEIGQCHIELQQYEKALIYFYQALEINENKTLNADTDKNIAVNLHLISRCYISLQQYDDALIYLNQALEIRKKATLDADTDRNIAMTFYNIGHCQIELQQYDEALIYLYQALEIRNNTTLNADADKNIATINHKIGHCYIRLQWCSKALMYLNKALEIEKSATLSADADKNIFTMLRDISHCHFELQQYDNALIHLNQALEIRKNATLDADIHKNIAMTLYDIIHCHIVLQLYDEALKHLDQALELEKNITLDAETDRNISMTLYDISHCHINLQQYEKALVHLNQALEIEKYATLDADTDKNIIKMLYDISACYIGLQQYDKALIHLNQALEIKKNATLDADRDINIAISLYDIGYCHIELQQYNEALLYLNQALEIKKNITLNADTSIGIATVLQVISECHFGLQQYDKALRHLYQALAIWYNTTFNADTDRNIAHVYRKIGRWCCTLRLYSEALIYLNRALEIYKNTTLDADTDKNIASTYYNFGQGHIGLQRYSEALIYLNLALEIYENATLDADTDESIAGALHLIGVCHLMLQKYSYALIYFNLALEINKNTTPNADRVEQIALALLNIGVCHFELQQYDEALICFNGSLEIYKNATLDVDTCFNIFHSINMIIRCHISLHHYGEALENLNRLLEIQNNTALEAFIAINRDTIYQEIGLRNRNNSNIILRGFVFGLLNPKVLCFFICLFLLIFFFGVIY